MIALRTRTKAGLAVCMIGALGVGWFMWVIPTDTSGRPLQSQQGEVPGPMPESARQAPASSQSQAEGRPQASSGLAFVINSGEASISLVDVATRAELRRIPVVREPHHMALTPDHRFLVVGDSAANELLFLDPATGEVVKRMAVSDPYQFGFSPDGKWFVVNALLRNQIDIFDAATMRLTSRIPALGMPSHLNFRYHVATATMPLFRGVGSSGYHPEP